MEDLPFEVIEKAMPAMMRRFIKKNVLPNANPPEEPRPLS
jgi:hypothetical protein